MSRKDRDEPRKKLPREVGSSFINCPLCGVLTEVPVTLSAIRIEGSSFYVDYRSEYHRHDCKGRSL